MSLLKHSLLMKNAAGSLLKTCVCKAQQPQTGLVTTKPLDIGELTLQLTRTSIRSGSTFTNMPLDQLWAGALGVSNAGKKKGRGKRGSARKQANIHAGKFLGYSKSKNFLYPGLNSKLMAGNTVVKMVEVEKPPGESERLLEIRNKANKFVRMKSFPLERGWSGRKMAGVSAGKPHKHQGYTFDGFDSRVLEFKVVCHMTGHLGRKHSHSALVAVGNGKGLIGTAVARSSLASPAIRKAKNVAGQKLQYINLKDNRTIWHPFYSEVGATRIFATPMPEGHGLVCHRAIKTIATCIGIKDIYVKVEGRTKNIQNVTEAFLSGLLKMETHQELADKTKYYVVELSDNYKVPTVLAEPSDGEINDVPIENFAIERHYMDGKTILRKPKLPAFFEKTNRYKHRDRTVFQKMRNQADLQILRKAAAIE
ncbi:small ribosomal subunit protein uS5m-like [Watersipora subatra]|uniref:small ribosomal subunit protein uS5m-like n=1 Tax=Watersipora subatra TaxID=2589382 RepID=UPI00355BFC4E